MRKIFLIACMTMFLTVGAQQNNPSQKTISVVGSASLEIVPDEIYLQVDLKEYTKKGTGKIDIEQIKANFLQACKEAGIADSCISIYSYGSNLRPYYWKKRKDKDDLEATLSYWIKFNGPTKLDALISRLDDEATEHLSIANISHSRITEYRKQLKIQAVKAAKEKAIYLSEAIGEKIGSAIHINEPDESYNFGRDNYAYQNGRLVQTNLGYDNDDQKNTIDFKKLKLRFEVSVVFALQ